MKKCEECQQSEENTFCQKCVLRTTRRSDAPFNMVRSHPPSIERQVRKAIQERKKSEIKDEQK